MCNVQAECRTKAYQEQTNIVQPAFFQSIYVYLRHSKLHAALSGCIILMLRRGKMQYVSLQRHINHVLHLQGCTRCSLFATQSVDWLDSEASATDLPVNLVH